MAAHSLCYSNITLAEASGETIKEQGKCIGLLLPGVVIR